MADQKTIRCTAPVARETPNDPHLFAALADMLMRSARIEADKACEGRSYTVDRVRFVITDGGPSFIRNLLDAELEITITAFD